MHFGDSADMANGAVVAEVESLERFAALASIRLVQQLENRAPPSKRKDITKSRGSCAIARIGANRIGAGAYTAAMFRAHVALPPRWRFYVESPLSDEHPAARERQLVARTVLLPRLPQWHHATWRASRYWAQQVEPVPPSGSPTSRIARAIGLYVYRSERIQRSPLPLASRRGEQASRRSDSLASLLYLYVEPTGVGKGSTGMPDLNLGGRHSPRSPCAELQHQLANFASRDPRYRSGGPNDAA
jgi:hypothetical protein